MDIARKIVQEIWNDICARSGGDHFLEACDSDVQTEMKNTWEEFINSNIQLDKGVKELGKSESSVITELKRISSELSSIREDIDDDDLNASYLHLVIIQLDCTLKTLLKREVITD